VPSLLEFLLRRPGQAPEGFREFLCGAGPLLVETVLEFEERYGVPVRHLYGLSETTAVLTLTPRMSESERRHWLSAHGTPSIAPAARERGHPRPHRRARPGICARADRCARGGGNAGVCGTATGHRRGVPERMVPHRRRRLLGP